MMIFFKPKNSQQLILNLLRLKKKRDPSCALVGNLTMKGVTKNVQVNAEFGGESNDNQGNLKAGFEVTGTINRKDFGLT